MPAFANALRDHGYDAKALEEAYPGRAESVVDLEWIQDAGENRWITLTVNPNMCRNPAELAAIRTYRARVFSLGSAQQTTVIRGLVIGRNWLSIMRRARHTDGCFWRLYFDRPAIKTIA
jgi:hypothetical protein